MFAHLAHPKIHQQYKDDRGVLVTIIGIDDSKVVFMREGYPYPCMRPINNFLNKFQIIPQTPNPNIS